MLGTINLHRFGRLTDLINASSGYIRVRDARLLLRNGEPTDLVLPEMMVDQDEVSFIAQREAVAPEPGAATGFIEPTFGDTVESRTAREFVMFTPGHMLSGRVYLFGQTDLAALRRFDRPALRPGRRRHGPLAGRPADRHPLRLRAGQPHAADRRRRDRPAGRRLGRRPARSRGLNARRPVHPRIGRYGTG